MNKDIGIYIAAPLFSDAERSFNAELKRELTKYFRVYLPQEDGKLIVNLIKNGLSFEDASRTVFDADIRAINESKILLIVLDGRTIDEGAAFELGYAYNSGKVCIGLSTDPRRLLPMGHNPMIESCLSGIFGDISAIVDFIKKTEGLC